MCRRQHSFLDPTTGLKVCIRCGQAKLAADFNKCDKSRHTPDRLRAACKACIKAWETVYRKENKEVLSVKHKEQHLKFKEEVLAHYGKDGKAVCVRCGFGDLRALSIDHINGKGIEHLRSIGIWKDTDKRRAGGGTRFYCWLKRNNYPEGFQTLCMNCQWIKRNENGEGCRKECVE